MPGHSGNLATYLSLVDSPRSGLEAKRTVIACKNWFVSISMGFNMMYWMPEQLGALNTAINEKFDVTGESQAAATAAVCFESANTHLSPLDEVQIKCQARGPSPATGKGLAGGAKRHHHPHLLLRRARESLLIIPSLQARTHHLLPLSRVRSVHLVHLRNVDA
jgi:hypothetical protein